MSDYNTHWITNYNGSNIILIVGGVFLLYVKRAMLLSKLTNTPMIVHNLQQKKIDYRTDDGSYNNRVCPYIGMSGQPFGKFIPFDSKYGLYEPDPQKIADILLSRNIQKNTNGNLFIAAWIQFMIHDWFDHKLDSSSKLPINDTMTVYKTKFHKETKYTINENSHFWDGSQIYKDSLRLFNGTGQLILVNDYLPIEDNIEKLGFNKNIWFGLTLMHLLFVKEHNHICEQLKIHYPDLGEDQLYNLARLINTAVIAKIHVVEWTPAILPAKIPSNGQSIAYNGIIGAQNKYMLSNIVDLSKIKLPFDLQTILIGGHMADYDNDNVNFAHIEEFSSVYRMHSLLPDNIKIFPIDCKTEPCVVELKDGLYENSKLINSRYPIKDLLYSFGKNKTCSLELNNYPSFLRNLKIPDNDSVIDLATCDILRDRERGVSRYNDFRRGFSLTPIKSFDELTDDKYYIQQLKLLYDNDVEKLDLLIGTHLEQKMPNCIFGETIYQLFLVHTLRRITNDRFYTNEFNSDRYTNWGMEYIRNITFKSLLLTHYPELNGMIPENAFDIFT
jgi:hypothetical protein